MEEPPLDMKGKVMPLAGISPTLTAMLMMACSANEQDKTRRRQRSERIGPIDVAREHPDQHQPEQPDDDEAGKHAVFLGDHGENEVRVRIRQHGLDGALARALAEEAALDEGLQRPVGLEGVTDGRVPEAIDAQAHVTEALVGCQQHAAQRGSHRDQQPAAAGPQSKSSAHHTRLTSSIWPTSGCIRSSAANVR